MFLSIVIVNWNSMDFLLPCLGSIYAQIKDVDFEVVVVDNASTENGFARIREQFPRVQLIESPTNLGFAGANNLGVKHTRGEYVLFLNPDTIVLGNALADVALQLDHLDDAGVMGCRLLNSDLTIQTSALLRFPTIVNQIFDIEYLKLRFPALKFWGIRPLFADGEDPREVEAISGACMFVKREAFEKAGHFDTRYFMYSEDIDLCYAIRMQGYKVYYTGAAEIIHHGGKSTARAKVKNFNIIKMKDSTYAFLIKWKGKGYADAYKSAVAAAACVRLLLLLIVAPAALVLHKGQNLRWAIAKWKVILVWSLGHKALLAGGMKPA